MKTGKELKTMWVRFNGDIEHSWQAIADAWNADLDACTWREQSLADNYAHSQQALQKARKQLRKLRQELAEAKGLAGVYFHQRGMHEETIIRLENLIERIAKGNR